jgi:hypothetical protein
MTDAEVYRLRLAARGVPEHLRNGLLRWVMDGIRPGDFLFCVLSNDLMGAFRRADPESRAGIWPLILFLENDAPTGCYGGPRVTQAWIETKGLRGLLARDTPA